MFQTPLNMVLLHITPLRHVPLYSTATTKTTTAAAVLSSGTSTAALLWGGGVAMAVIMAVLFDMMGLLVSAFMSVIATMTAAAAVSKPEFAQLSCTR
jgi:hypothetical protein